ncbi:MULTISPECIES: winged helix-turn-helix transcriptional regulator [Mycobacteriaceae]|uniref:Winged helix-turn-helix transcriptional regulator n=1 Tax=Mycolicibacterium parafortuitum TaxID=39692 RepID=A0ACC6ME89_MYCPF|nr:MULTISPECIES: winged helix-turn-helix transcriptional regulator [Mycobacteriaceae]MDZ5085284.1 winged helix-turn-helix transcriptional regulator [Mycolicibacterium parafortuitum]GFM17582.1 HxlR family transcriptional regulator [Mycobacterium sp. PO1]GFM21843.1 HxlR family transcriptional regulator [Mycobacterium sp. PO2]
MGTMADVARKTYGQFCGLAHALDVVGERWTLLIVRELGTGPKRYTDLADALTGIGTSLLATRVRQLETDGVIQRRLAVGQPGSAVVYELSEAGRELALALIPLATWGARHQMTDADIGREAFRAEWLLSFLAADLTGDTDPGPDAVYEFHIGDSSACLQVRGGRMRVAPGPAATPPDVTVRAAAPTVAALLGRQLTLSDAVRSDQVDISGDAAATDALVALIESHLALS